MSIEQINNHSEIAIDKLLAQFKEKPKIDALIRMQTDQIQDLENAAFGLYVGRSLQTATGATLDRWGNLLGELRSGRSDSEYRAAMFFKITRNIAQGTPSDLISIFQILTGAQNVKYSEQYPATAFLVGIGMPEGTDTDILGPYIKAAAPAGVRLGQITVATGDRVFGFEGYPASFLSGFGDLGDPSVGGFLASNIEV
jgi:hypothetical protein